MSSFFGTQHTHVRSQKERQDQLDRSEDTIYNQPMPDQPAKLTTSAIGTGNPFRYAHTEDTIYNHPTPD
jgi:hypothetical protein